MALNQIEEKYFKTIEEIKKKEEDLKGFREKLYKQYHGTTCEITTHIDEIVGQLGTITSVIWADDHHLFMVQLESGSTILVRHTQVRLMPHCIKKK